MNEYILFMHDDGGPTADDDWGVYLTRLKESGVFQGGSSIGGGVCLSRAGEAKPISAQLSGYIKVSAETLEDAKLLVHGNPAFVAGGTVEIRELVRD